MPRVRGVFVVLVGMGLLGGLPAWAHAGPAPGGVPELQNRVAALEERVAALEALLANVTLVEEAINGLAGPHLLITGANVHIRSGSGSTADGGDPQGLGNLVIGYNEAPAELAAGERGGSHNVVVGPEHRYSSVGGLVAGAANTVSGDFASVAGGGFNEASGDRASVSGGAFNEAGGQTASVSGGLANTAGASWSSVSGGNGNEATGQGTSVSGGQTNVASGSWASVTGGRSNTASGGIASVGGGLNRTAPGDFDWAAGGLIQDQ